MSGFAHDLRRAKDLLRQHGLITAVLIAMGLFFGWLISLFITIGALMLILGVAVNGGSAVVLVTIFTIAKVLGTTLVVVAIGAAARGLFLDQDGDTLRHFGWQAVPVVIPMLAVIGAVQVVLPGLIGSLVSSAITWLTLIALVDIAAGRSKLGLPAVAQLLRADPARVTCSLVGALVIVGIPVGIAQVMLGPLAGLVTTVPSLTVQLTLVVALWQSQFESESPVAVMAREAAAKAERMHELRVGVGDPSYMVARDEADMPQVERVAAAFSMPDPVNGELVLEHGDQGAGIWFGEGLFAGQLTLSLRDPIERPQFGAYIATTDGTWYQLAAQDGRTAITPFAIGPVPAGPWYVLVQDAGPGTGLVWELQPAPVSSDTPVLPDAPADGEVAA